MLFTGACAPLRSVLLLLKRHVRLWSELIYKLIAQFFRNTLSYSELMRQHYLLVLRDRGGGGVPLIMDAYSLGYFTWLYLSLMLDVSSLGLVYGCFISCFVRLVGKQKSPISASQNMLLPRASAIENGFAELHYRRFRN